ncbi:MAG TPA: copper amine oxidase N-terminal domain-containing protein [Verrucomicrobiae bacterium]|nr:copper amine oxidase N-terminal domain-containing protein [Verrucomicrobiae bacterium]
MRITVYLAACAASIVLATGAFAAPVLAQQSVGVTVIVNGTTMSFDQPPVEQAGRVFVPLRGVFEQLGASVVYQNGQINATGDGRTVSLQIGSTQATVDGQPQTLDQAPFVQGSRTLVPLRFVAQALGASVDWNNNTSTVTINGGGGPRGGGGGGYNRPAPRPMNPAAYLTDRSPEGRTSPTTPISATFTQPMDRNSIRVSVDGTDVSSAVYFNANGFQYTPRRPLYPGTHTVRVSGTTRSGASFSTSWEFRV